jgi:hypothetical protein
VTSLAIRPESDAETVGDLLHLVVACPQHASVEIGAGEKMSVHVAHASADDAIFACECHHLFVSSRWWSDQRVESAEGRRAGASADPEIEFRQDQWMHLGDSLTEQSDKPLRDRLTIREGQPNLGVDADQLRTRRRRGAVATASSNSPARRSDTNCRTRALKPASTTPFREVGAESFRRNRSSLTALVASSSSAPSMSSVVLTAETITPGLRTGFFPDAFRPYLPRTAGERKT